MTTKLKVLYIIGHARSGSTILGHYLSKHPQIEHFGELKVLAERAWYKPEYCSCGKLGDSCEFWSKVKEELIQKDLLANVDALVHWQNQYDKLRHIYQHLWHGYASQEFNAYANSMRAIFSSIHELSNVEVILDSSKTPARAYSLSKALRSDELYFVHLVRDPRGVTWSLLKSLAKNRAAGIEKEMPPRSPLRTVSAWLTVNLLSEYVGRRASNRYLILRYEDFVAEPDRAMTDVYDMLGLDKTIVHSDNSAKSFSNSHVIAGNMVRMRDNTTIRGDYEWQEKMPIALQKQIWRYTGWLAKRYGYGKGA